MPFWAFGPSPLDAAGGGGQGAGIFRELGLRRTRGDLNPAQYLMLLQMQPNYDRFKQLIQGLVRKSHGDEFEVFRGQKQTDPLMQALQVGAPSPVTAVASMNDPKAAQAIAERIAQGGAEVSRKPAFVAAGKARPEDVAAIVPRRLADYAEGELVLGPGGFKGNIVAKYLPPSGGMPTMRKPLDPVAELLDALSRAVQPLP